MSKTKIKDSEGMKTPFLKGILTSSLLNAGVEFELAYEIASKIKDHIDNKEQVSTEHLRKIILKQLEKNVEPEVIERFLSAAHIASTIMITNNNRDPEPFSRGHHRLCMESCGLSSDEASSITMAIYNELLHQGHAVVSSNDLGRMSYNLLLAEFGKITAQRYLIWADFLHSERPLLLLIGGTAGVGKSTIATEVGHRFGIVRTQSTDMLREVMRMMTPPALSPVLHASSYNAWKVLPDIGHNDSMTEDLLISGYLRQAEQLSVACEAIANRAFREKVSLILEGVHINPILVNKIARDKEVIVVSIMLSVLKAGKLKSYIKGRGKDVPERRSKRYLNHFNEIWELQSYLMAEADNHKIPIVSNTNRDNTIQEVMICINDALLPHFSHDLDKVFPI